MEHSELVIPTHCMNGNDLRSYLVDLKIDKKGIATSPTFESPFSGEEIEIYARRVENWSKFVAYVNEHSGALREFHLHSVTDMGGGNGLVVRYGVLAQDERSRELF